ncbi:ankyrin repeat domain-containing protein, partial [Aspergillus saccharolyticus JOP 1030-1]
GQTPLHHACRKGDEETVRLLIRHNSDIRAADSKYWQPLHITADAGHERIVRILLEHGA